MKTRYQMHSKLLDCDVQFTYTSNGTITGFEFMDDKDRKVEHIIEILQRSLTITDLKANCKAARYDLIEIIENISFDMFWDKYDSKDGSSKVICTKLWKKLDDVNRSGAYNYIPQYVKHLQSKPYLGKKLAETYLRSFIWVK